MLDRLRGGPVQLRPPWTGPEEHLLRECTRCDRCIAACPTGALARGHGGYPIVDFARAGCTFCGACADACEDGCFSRGAAPPWRLRARLSSACVAPKGVTCRRCEEACDAGAIRFRLRIGGSAIAAIDPSLCSGCGACVVPCPVSAITIVDAATVETQA